MHHTLALVNGLLLVVYDMLRLLTDVALNWRRRQYVIQYSEIRFVTSNSFH